MPDDPWTLARGRAYPSLAPSSADGDDNTQWDDVSEASWEAFPASDPPAWISRVHGGETVDNERKSGQIVSQDK